ncbi:hypothetical protein Tco_0236641 [Tanacetum coccineum]
MAHNEEQRDTPQLELKDTTAIDNLGPNRNDDGIEWLDVEEPLDLVNTRLGRDMHIFVGNMSYVMDFTILESIENNIDPSFEDDYDRGCRKPSDLEDGFYSDTIKLGPEYATGMDDEGEDTRFLIKNEEDFFTVPGDGVGIKPDGVVSPAM